MIIKTRGIILRTVKYSETSVIADIFTEGAGLRSYIISGMRARDRSHAASENSKPTLRSVSIWRGMRTRHCV